MDKVKYFSCIQGVPSAVSNKEINIESVKYRLHNDLYASPNYATGALRNGVPQDLIIFRSDVPYKATLLTFPDEKVNEGDYIYYNDETWLVYEVGQSSTWQNKAVLWLCNLKLTWQSFNDNIIEQWCVFDDGVYSTTINGNDTLKKLNVQRKILLQYNDYSKMLHIDKRLATGTTYDKSGREILEVFKITAHDRIANSHAQTSKLLTLSVASAYDYDESTDNLELLLCDYIAPEEHDEPTIHKTGSILKCAVSGRSSIRIGSQRKYAAKFYLEDGETEVPNITPVWSVDAPVGVSHTQNGSFITVIADNDPNLIGSTVTITLVDELGTYEPAVFEVEVVDVA